MQDACHDFEIYFKKSKQGINQTPGFLSVSQQVISIRKTESLKLFALICHSRFSSIRSPQTQSYGKHKVAL
jgi:hypothetical protein